MAKILLLETATEVCSAAISVDGRIVAMEETPRADSHSAVLTLQIEACSRAAGIPLDQLDAVAVSAGPGAYTSLRVGVTTAKGLCYALGKPLLAIDTLRALAEASRAAAEPSAPAFYVPMIDARRQEVWTAVYGPDMQMLAPAQPLILENSLFESFLAGMPGYSPDMRLIISGSGGKKIENVPKIGQAVLSDVSACSAAFLSELAEANFKNADFQDVAYFEPVYMKPPNITLSTKSLL